MGFTDGFYNNMTINIQTLVIGGGFYGCYISEFLSRKGHDVLLVERGETLLGEASKKNQARVHNGYHYPRSVLTGLRSRISMPKFVNEFSDCIVDSFEKIYAIGKINSNISPNQFVSFCERIKVPCEVASNKISNLFNPDLIAAVYTAEEYAFDSLKLSATMKDRLSNNGVVVRLQTEAQSIVKIDDKNIEVVLQEKNKEKDHQIFDNIINCTYASLNETNFNSKLPIIPLKHEFTEMVLTEVPDEIRSVGVTIMCGPYFSIMPYPSTALHSLSHVRYTPHYSWFDSQEDYKIDTSKHTIENKPRSNYERMYRDVIRYLPILEDMTMKKSIWAIKSVLPQSETDDSRPILFAKNHGGLKGYHCILGGKIDNIYDILQIILEEKI